MSTNGTPTAMTATATALPSAPIEGPTETPTDKHTTAHRQHPEQLTLLSASDVPLQFRIDERTRRSGLAHIAALREQVAAQAAQRNLSTEGKRLLSRTPNRQIAA